MRKTFRRCGYLKEGHYRKDWMSSTGEKFDTVKYGILRDDWLTGKSTPVDWNDELQIDLDYCEIQNNLPFYPLLKLSPNLIL